MFDDNGIEIFREDTMDFPEEPTAPIREKFDTEEEFDFANDDYEVEMSCYKADMLEIETLFNTYPTMRKCINISHLSPRFSYFTDEEEQSEDVDQQDTQRAEPKENGCDVENSCMKIVQTEQEQEQKEVNDDEIKSEIAHIEGKIEYLEESDERLKQKVEVSTYFNLVSILTDVDTTSKDSCDLDMSLLFYFLTDSVKKNLFKYFGFSDNLYLSDENKFTIISNLNERQKTILIRQIVIGKFNQTHSKIKHSLIKQYCEFLCSEKANSVIEAKSEYYAEERKSLVEKIVAHKEQVNDLRKQLSDYVETDQNDAISLTDQVDTTENPEAEPKLDEDERFSNQDENVTSSDPTS